MDKEPPVTPAPAPSALPVALSSGWEPVTRITGKDAAESARVGERIGAIPKNCWTNARKAVLRLKKYADASYVEGVIVLEEVGILIEHGWLCRADGTVIDPTLPHGVAAYFPGLEFPGRTGIAAFLATESGRACRDLPFHDAFGFGGNRSPSYRAAWESAWAFHRVHIPSPGAG